MLTEALVLTQPMSRKDFVVYSDALHNVTPLLVYSVAEQDMSHSVSERPILSHFILLIICSRYILISIIF